MTTASTSEVLNKAADILEIDGWTKGVAGTRCNGPKCLMGALAQAQGIPLDPGFPDAEVFDYEYVGNTPAALAVASQIGWTESPGDLWSWNDNRGHTADEVIAVLRAAAETV